MTAYTARALSTNLLQNVISQTAHGFTIGKIVRFDGANYVLAKADTFTHSQSVGMVSYVLNANQFILTQAGYIANIPATIVEGAPLIAGGYYYLSPNVSGDLTLTQTVTDYQVVVACFIADSASSGYYFNNSGTVNIPGGGRSGFGWNVANVNTVMSVNNGYVINGAGTLTITLPPTSLTGDLIEIAGYSAGGWIVAQSDQTVHFGNMSTTPGAGGSLASTVQYDTIKLLSVTDSPAAEWIVLTADGNITIV